MGRLARMWMCLLMVASCGRERSSEPAQETKIGSPKKAPPMEQDWEKLRANIAALETQGNNVAANAATEALITALQQNGKEHEILLADLLCLRGMFLRSQGRYGEATEAVQQGLAIEAMSTAHEQRIECLFQLGTAYTEQRKTDEAKLSWAKYLQQAREVYGERSAPVISGMKMLAVAHDYASEFEEAETLLRKAHNLAMEVLGKDHPQVATLLIDIATNLEYQERFDEAIQMYRQGIAGSAERNDIRGTAYNGIGNIHYSLGKLDKAEKAYRRSLSARISHWGERHPRIAYIWNNLSVVAAERGQRKKALDYCDKAIDLRKEFLAANHPLRVETEARCATLRNSK